MKTQTSQQAMNCPPYHRAIFRVSGVECRVSQVNRCQGAPVSRREPTDTLPRSTRSTLHAVTALTLGFGLWTLDCLPATITGNLTDLSLAPLNTTLQFNPDRKST